MPCYVIYNDYSGTWIHETLFRIKTFCSRRQAENYIQKNNLNTRFYKVEVRT